MIHWRKDTHFVLFCFSFKPCCDLVAAKVLGGFWVWSVFYGAGELGMRRGIGFQF